MLKSSMSALFLCAIFLLFWHSYAQDVSHICSNYKFQQKTFEACSDLQALDSSIHWTYNDSSKAIDMAFRMIVETKDTWVAWGINPTSTGMVGCETFVGLRQTDGSVNAYTTPIKSYATRLQPGNLSFTTYEVSATADEKEMIIFAKFELPGDATNVNHVWQEGPLVNNDPRIHALTGPNIKSLGTINFMSGKSTQTTTSKDSRMQLKLVHGMLNMISWGVMMPVGAIIARYVKVFPSADPAWFYLHLICQVIAYFMGISGEVIGFVLGNQSQGIEYSIHRNIGIALFALSSLQVLAICLRPDKKNKLRFYWNIYHRSIGYGTIILGVANIFLGLAIMEATRWRFAYTIFIAILVSVAILLEAVTWFLVLRNKSQSSKHGET